MPFVDTATQEAHTAIRRRNTIVGHGRVLRVTRCQALRSFPVAEAVAETFIVDSEARKRFKKKIHSVTAKVSGGHEQTA